MYGPSNNIRNRNKITDKKMNCLSSPSIQVSSLGFLPKLNYGQVISPSSKSRKSVVKCQGKNSRKSINNYTQAVAVEAPVVVEENGRKDEGIGIVKFVKGKNFFITGATGFLGKVLIEKLLRSTPDIGKIYLMIQARDKEVAAERLKKEIIEADIFKNMKERLGGSYESFMLSKLIPVKGNMGDSDLNLDKDDAQMVARDVHFIISSAASTTFDERYDVSMKINTKGPCNLLAFGKKCDKLELFLQISTAYANGKRKGRVMERLFTMGDTIARENSSAWGNTSSSSPLLDVENELSLALNSNSETDDSLRQFLKNLGQQRANIYGWQDTYVFTKAMGEMMINHMRGDIPVVILRPSIIESTFRDPFPGWIEGNRMIDPLITMYGKGLTSGFLGLPHYLLDVVPADMVVNATVAALAKHGKTHKPEINMYQVTSSIENPMYIYNLGDSSFNHFNSNPHIDTNGVPVIVSPWKFFDSKEEFISCVRVHLSNGSTNIGFTRLQERITKQIEHLTQVYEPYTGVQTGRFDMNNTLGLLESMSDEEKETFGFDVKEIDWKDYLENIHIPGLRKHAMKGRGVSI